MAASFPYSHYACPCSGLTSTAPLVDGGDEASFNPHSPRSNYSLYPLHHLLYCDECDAIRCPRCWTEETINWYCPACLFEVPSSAVKGDGNRCSRNCYNCPLCVAPLVVTAVAQPSADRLKPDDAGPSEAYTLQCQYCDWSSLNIGVKFARPTKITDQLVQLRKAKTAMPQDDKPPDLQAVQDDKHPLTHDDAFANLTRFYKEQLSEAGDLQNPYSNSPYSSPANLARIMSLYGGLSYNALKKSREKPQPMREAGNSAEGLAVYTVVDDNGNREILQKMESMGLESTTSAEQRLSTPLNYDAKFVDQLWPVATRLRTRRGKRCRTCRQFLTRPDPKINHLRYKVRLLATNHIPRLAIRPLHAPPNASHRDFPLSTNDPEQPHLRPHSQHQYILTVRNPIFETVKVTLATPATTPGKVASRVTILCPSFTVGPAGDVWDEALGSSTSTAPPGLPSGAGAPTTNDGGRQAAMASLTGSADPDRQPEAGKIWERTRNSTSVVLEIVPGPLEPSPAIVPRTERELVAEPLPLDEDDDVLEVPVYVRAEWDAHVDEAEREKRGAVATEGEGTVSKELAYWCVLGVGRIG